MKKGNYGYISYKQKQSILFACGMLALILAVYFAALHHFGTNQNLFSIVAALMCLPEGKLVINMIMFLRAKGCSQKLHEEIEASQIFSPEEANRPAAYDLYLTAYEKNYQLSHLAVMEKNVIAVTEDPNCGVKDGEQHIRKMMQGNGYHDYSVKIFRDTSQYLLRAEQLAERDPKKEISEERDQLNAQPAERDRQTAKFAKGNKQETQVETAQAEEIIVLMKAISL